MNNTLKHPRDYRAKRLALALQLCSIFAACANYAGVAVKWTAETSRVHPEIVEAWRGDTLDLACTLKSYGQPITLGAATASFMWQTNGMGNAWWQTNATVSAGGVIRATWSPAMDPGVSEVAFFMPVQSAGGASYRAAGRIRFRPSPGAGSQTIDLPQPGGTLDFGAYQLVNAPWATLDAVNSAIDANNAIIGSAISSATGALVIPPAVDLGPYATTGIVLAAVQTSSNGLANAIQVAFTAASNRTDAVAADLAAEISSTSNGLRSVLRDTIAESTTASRAYSDAVASNAQRAATAAIPSLAGYATQEWAANYFSTNYTPPDLSSYASRSYADAAASNAQRSAIAAIPSLTGYATQSWTANYFSTNYTPPDLSSYASRSYADAAASNAQATAIAAIPSLAGYATETYAQNAAGAAASDALSAAQSYALSLSWATSVGNTRLVSADGTIWQDATGTVWQVSVTSYGWAGTVVDTATSTANPVVFNYVPATTYHTEHWVDSSGNWIYFDAGMSDTWILSIVSTNGVEEPFSPLGDQLPDRSATNLTYDTGTALYSLIYRPVALATNVIDHVLYESTGGGGGGLPSSYAAVSNAAMSAAAQTNDFLRLTGGYMQGTICFPYFDNYGVEISTLHPGALAFRSTYPDYSDLYATLDLTRIPTNDPYYGQSEIAFLSDIPSPPDLTPYATVNGLSAAATAATNYTDWCIQHLDPPLAEFDAYAEDVTNVAIAVVREYSQTPAAPETTAALRWHADGTACVVSVAAGGTLTASTNNWVEGQAVLATITLASGAGVASNIELVGYSAWPTGTAFVACCYRIGQKVYVVPSTTL